MRSTLFGFCAQLLLLTVSAVAHSAAVDELRNALFESANQALGKANAAQASVLAPTSYSQGAEYYQRAEATLASGGSIDSIRRNLDKAVVALDRAAEQGGLAALTFQTILQARQDAISADAQNYASTQWIDAEKVFNEATVRLEKGRLKNAERRGEDALTAFREAELVAIKANYLNETRVLLAQAKDLRAPRYAPSSYNSSVRLLAEAEGELNNNRYDTDRPRSLAQAAKHDALHAIFVAELEQSIRDDETSLEAILLQWEVSIRRLADAVDTPVYFDAGENEAIDAVAERIARLQEENARLAASLDDREVQLSAMSVEAAAAERLSVLVARQDRQRKRLATVEALFDETQATVLRQGDAIIIRMIGLNFDVGSAVLKDNHLGLLSTLQNAINLFPESNIVIEGHTDAFGSDEMNQQLSQQRADSVEEYLLTNTPVSPVNLTALGYGESRPVSNNETKQGRKRNRRIDIVIYPKW